MTAATPHILMSASKSIVGLLCGVLQHLGVLELEALVSQWIPEIAQSAYRGATLRHLLDMRAGVIFDELQLRCYANAANWDPLDPSVATADLRSFFASNAGTAKPHGGSFSYISANTDLLGWAIERATGKSVANLLSEYLYKPLGAEHSAYITLDRKGLARCTGGIGMTARDFARIGQLVLEAGRREGREVIPAAWIDDIAKNGDRQAWHGGEWGKLFPYKSMSYRNGWYVIDDAPTTLFAMGIHGQNLMIDTENHLVIAKLSSQAAPIDHPAWMLTHRALPELRRRLNT